MLSTPRSMTNKNMLSTPRSISNMMSPSTPRSMMNNNMATTPTSNPINTNVGGGGYSMNDNGPLLECDYDVNPTYLYLSIQSKNWEQVQTIIEAHPWQTKTWVKRKESIPNTHETKTRWNLLPLHAAIIFKAPESIIQALLIAYPKACSFKDDQGMLPIHLALRNESSEAVVTMLLVAYPQSAQIGDRKNRTPLRIVQMLSSSQNKSGTFSNNDSLPEKYNNALQNFKLYYDVASASFNALTPHDAKYSHTNANHKNELDAQKLSLMAKVDSLERELTKSRDGNQLLVDHANDLKSKLDFKTNPDSDLLRKIYNLEADLKELKQDKEILEQEKEMMGAHIKLKLDTSSKQMEVLFGDLRAKEKDIELYKKINYENNKSLEIAAALEKSLVAFERENREKLERKIEALEAQTSNVTALETQLKEKMRSEHSLAMQVNDFASKFSESAISSSEMTNSYESHISSHQKEKIKMKQSYSALLNHLKDSMQTLELVTAENSRIVELSGKQEKVIADMYQQQDDLAAQAARHEQTLIDAAWERDEIARILARQAEDVERSNVERDSMMELVKENQKFLTNSDVEADRSELINSVSNQKGLVRNLKEEVKYLLHAVHNEANEFGLDNVVVYDDKENGCEVETRLVKKSHYEYQYGNKMNILSVGTAEDPDGSIEMLSCNFLAVSESLSDINNSYNGLEDENDTLGEISMNNKNQPIIVHFSRKSKANVGNNVDSRRKEAAALLASNPSPAKRNY